MNIFNSTFRAAVHSFLQRTGLDPTLCARSHSRCRGYSGKQDKGLPSTKCYILVGGHTKSNYTNNHIIEHRMVIKKDTGGASKGQTVTSEGGGLRPRESEGWSLFTTWGESFQMQGTGCT